MKIRTKETQRTPVIFIIDIHGVLGYLRGMITFVSLIEFLERRTLKYGTV